MSFTPAEIADAAAASLGLDRATRDAVHETVRTLIASAVVPAEAEPTDRRGTRPFDLRAAATMLACAPLAAAGVSTRTLRPVAAQLQAADLTGTAPILRALASLRAGGWAELALIVSRDDWRVVATVETSADVPSDEVAAILDDAAERHLVETRVDLQILRALVE